MKTQNAWQEKRNHPNAIAFSEYKKKMIKRQKPQFKWMIPFVKLESLIFHFIKNAPSMNWFLVI